MKERPILFSAPMVRAILAGDKTQTRSAWQARAAIAAQQAAPGWVLVPKEPTPEMLAAVRNGPMHETWAEGYRAMLAAAPSAQQAAPEDCLDVTPEEASAAIKAWRAQQAAQPLTEAQIDEIIERAHRIGEQP